MAIIKIITNDTTKTLEVAHVSNAMTLAHLCAWRIEKPIKLDGVELHDGANINFGDAVVEMDQQKCEGVITLFVNKEGALLKCSKHTFGPLDFTDDLTHAVNGRRGFGGSVGPFFFNGELCDEQGLIVALKVIHKGKIYDSTIIDTVIDYGHTQCSYDGVGVSCTISARYDNGVVIWLNGSTDFLWEHNEYSREIYRQEINNAQRASGEANLVSSNEPESGLITIENMAGFAVNSFLTYSIDGKRFACFTDFFNTGVKRSMQIVPGATDVNLSVYDPGSLIIMREIYSEHFDGPVNRNYRVTGTLAHPECKEI